jgi:multidrug efflux pump subunit AcrA (membrane-fusion protein)
LTRLDAAIDATTRTVYGTVRIDQPYNVDGGQGMPLAVGLYVDAEVEGRLALDAIQIAAEGLRAGDEVFVLNGEGLLDVRQVSVLHRNRETVLLASGVEAGDRVIVSAIRNPIRGMRLEAIDDAVLAESQGATDSVSDDNEA